MKELVLGLGNPILGDDGIGIVVARALGERIGGLDFAVCPTIGLDFLDILAGYDRAYVVDAMCTRGGLRGEVKRISPHGGPGTMHLFNSHGLHFFEVLELAQSLGLETPGACLVFGIEIGDCVRFEETISDELAERLHDIVDEIAAEIEASRGVGSHPGAHCSDMARL